MGKSPLIRSILVGCIAGTVLYGVSVPGVINANSEPNVKFCKAIYSPEVVKTIRMVITAYSSTEDQTDDTPFITASGKYVQDGFVANNMLPFGTKIRIPELYGDKVFVVEDRMHQRKGKYHADIWFPEYQQAKQFGAKFSNIEILES